MLNQVPFEALYSATYVENYLDCVENLPDALQRHLTRMRELDVSYRACLRDVENNIANCFIARESETSQIQSNKRIRAISRIQQSLIAAQELGDEKLQIVQIIQDIIDNTSRQLDGDYRKLASCLECGNGGIKEELSVESLNTIKESNLNTTAATPLQQSGANGGSGGGRPPTPPHNQDRDRERNEKDRTGERASKRARRSRTDVVSGNDINERVSGAGMNTSGSGGGSGSVSAGSGVTSAVERETAALPAASPAPDPPQRTTANSNNSSHKKTGAGKIGTGKKKKRKCRQSAAQPSQRDETPPPEDPDTIDPDEPTYCLCDQISFGEMILCDNDLCPIEWFHFSCVSLSTKPKGKWFCPKCRGDRPNVMKPKVQFLKELERYNKEKEEKA